MCVSIQFTTRLCSLEAMIACLIRSRKQRVQVCEFKILRKQDIASILTSQNVMTIDRPTPSVTEAAGGTS